ncbi:hypothetical protein GCM10009849_30600 [Sinomonas flava]|uniref:PKD domain-containing protein n=2 Tax=Sinomonas flava TaxID=496857 RepID=A0ABP5NVQ7_9MICC
MPGGLVAGAPQPYWDRACLTDPNEVATKCLPQQDRCGGDGELMQLMVPVPGATPARYAKSGTPTCQFPDQPMPAQGPAAIPPFTQKEFRELPLAAAIIGSQPGRHTLKGAETNIYADAKDQTFNLTLAGHGFVIRARPAEYRWTYGDGAALTTPAPGGPIPESRWGEKTVTSHAYAATGTVAVGLTTIFTGEYSVNGGPFQAIVGTAEVPSLPRTLSIWRSEVKRYADDCNVNPAGDGCS